MLAVASNLHAGFFLQARTRVALPALLLLLTLAGSVLASEQAGAPAVSAAGQDAAAEPAFAVTRSDLSNTIPAGQPILIDNPYGDVRLRFGGYQHAVDIHATLQQREGAAPIALQPREDNGRHLIAPRLPAGAVLAADQRIDLVVYVPEKHAVSVRTHGGLIEGRGVKSDLDLRSVDGGIILRGTEGSVQAETGGGAIEISLATAPPGARQRIATRTGNILIGVTDRLDAELEMATSGVFATEYSLTVKRRPGEEPNKQARTTIGEAKSTLVVESRRGEIRLLRRAEYNAVPGEASSEAAEAGEKR